jgi:hypothetical protein
MVSPDRSRGTLPNADLRSSAIRTRRGTRPHRQRLGIRNWVAMPCRGEESWLIPAYRRHRPDESLAATVIEFLSCWPLWITVMIGCENTYLPFQLISEQFLVHLFVASSPWLKLLGNWFPLIFNHWIWPNERLSLFASTVKFLFVCATTETQSLQSKEERKTINF